MFDKKQLLFVKPTDLDEWPGWTDELNPLVNMMFTVTDDDFYVSTNDRKWISAGELIKLNAGEKMTTGVNFTLVISSNWLVDVADKVSLL
jgi:hypothetical protein